MVKRENDGQTLYFMQLNQKVSVGMTDPGCGDVLSTMDGQLQARRDNLHNLELYNNTITKAQVSVDAGRNPGPLPSVPMMTIVLDPTIDEFGTITPGESTTAPFPDSLVHQIVYPQHK